jgi:hypothetical protein
MKSKSKLFQIQFTENYLRRLVLRSLKNLKEASDSTSRLSALQAVKEVAALIKQHTEYRCSGQGATRNSVNCDCTICVLEYTN